MRLHHVLRTGASAVAVGVAVFGMAGPAFAQQAAQQPVDDGPIATVDDIVVTAQRREQNLQDVPIVVTSLSQEVLQDAGVRDIKDLQILTPGMTVTSTTSEASTTVRIRGVGTVGDNPGLESSVGVVIDGVYRSRNGVGFGDLGELQRIEILKGPQGTLFGKNTSAGVVNIITEAPSFDPEYSGEVTVGNFGARGVAASMTGPINDQVAMRLYAARRERDGFYDVDLGDGPRTRTDDQNQDFWTVRGQLLVLPSDNVSVRLIGDYSRRDEFCCLGVNIRTGPTFPFVDALSTGSGQRPPAPGFGELPFSRTAFANRGTEQRIEDRGLSAEANIDLNRWGDATLTSVTSWRNWNTSNGMDVDYTGADILYRVEDGDYGYGVENITQEFRLAGRTERFDWLVGLFGTMEDVDRTDSYYLGADYTPFLSFLLSANINAANPAVPVSPGIVGCFTRPGQTTAGFQGCLASGGTGRLPVGPGGAVVTVPFAQATGPGFIVGQGVEDKYTQGADSVAIFGDTTWRVTDRFDLTLGLRYTHDRKTLDALQTNQNGNGVACAQALGNAGAITPVLGANTPVFLANLCLPWANAAYANRRISERFSDGELSGTVKAAFRPTDWLLAYGSYARGYKSFGYNLDRVQTGVTPNASLLFPSETVDSYELGVKTTLLNRTLLLNATLFDQTFDNFQLNTFLGTAFVVESIPELKTRGVDADLLWFTPVEGLSLTAGLTYTDSEYGNFTAADLTTPGNFPQLSLLPGAPASFAPKWSATGGINFDRSVGSGLRLGMALSAKYTTEYNTGSDNLPFKQQGELTVVNGRVSIGAESELWTLDIWAQNLTDEEYYQVVYNAPLQGTAFQRTVQPNGTFYNPALDTQTYNAFLGQPRTYGATLRVRY